MKLLFLAGLGQSLGQIAPVVDPEEYWTRGTDETSSSYAVFIRGPLGANTLPNLDDGETWSEAMSSWDPTHNYDSSSSYSSNLWPWLTLSSDISGEEVDPSDFYIVQYKYQGIEGLKEVNSAGKLLSL